MKLLRLKRKAPGLAIIAYIGVTRCILLPLCAFAEHFGSLGVQQIFWVFVEPLILFFMAWLACFALVKQTQEEKIDSPFFEKFSAWKGLAILAVVPATELWAQFALDYHQALNFLNPFTSLGIMQVAFIALWVVAILIALISDAFRLLRGKKLRKPEREFLAFLRAAIPDLLWIKFFFREAGPTLFGRSIIYFTGVSYLAFYYMAFASLITPASFAVNTSGEVLKAEKIGYVWVGKYGSHRGNYCSLKINSSSGALQFALGSCPACAEVPGAKVTVTHHPVDYQNKRISSVACDKAAPQLPH